MAEPEDSKAATGHNSVPVTSTSVLIIYCSQIHINAILCKTNIIIEAKRDKG
jgi:hypothetical protein